MALTVRLSTGEQEALATLAERSGPSHNKVLRAALRDYVERQSRAELLVQVMDQGLPPLAEALDRLGQ
ncbi:MAG: ribbon-helix-helix protein, CopG family [Actinomycetales bacterium]|nr:ribbon-helix-helix protein, CopG family [Actinomycetales bacterium]